MFFSYPEIDPIIFSIGPLAIRWYSLAYVIGIAGGGMYIDYLNKKAPSYPQFKALDDLLVWAIAGIILGGRLGYVIFYNGAYYLQYPLEALQIWQGGMSFHGGLTGLTIAIFLFSRKREIPFLALTDFCAAAAPIGLAFGRVANFINGELYGRVTDAPIGMVFPHAGSLPRHPSQLYEAALEGVVLFIVLFYAAKKGARHALGLLSGLFLCGYAIARIIIEYFREPDAQLGFIFADFITMGQILSLPMLLLGLYLIHYSRTHRI